MADKNPSPEKRLLEIIEGQNGKDNAPTPLAQGNKYLSLGSLKSRLLFFKDKLKPGGLKFRKPVLNLKTVNAVLQILIMLAVIALIVCAKIDFDFVNRDNMFSSGTANESIELELVAVASLLKPEEIYLEKAKRRDIFQFADEKRKKLVDFKEDKQKETKLTTLMQDLKLVGISWSDEPDAIVENSKIKKTYFVKKGYRIDELFVKEIFKDRVILRYKGEEVELK